MRCCQRNLRQLLLRPGPSALHRHCFEQMWFGAVAVGTEMMAVAAEMDSVKKSHELKQVIEQQGVLLLSYRPSKGLI